jgi:hypothetical protein
MEATAELNLTGLPAPPAEPAPTRPDLNRCTGPGQVPSQNGPFAFNRNRPTKHFDGLTCTKVSVGHAAPAESSSQTETPAPIAGTSRES